MDEHGLPRSWRRDPPDEALLEGSAAGWALFEGWCLTRGLSSFPASRETVLQFLREPPVSGPALFEVWEAINARHEAYYWHTDANPVLRLRFGRGVYVEPDGTIVLPDTE